ncbi:MAG: ribonuclease P protein component [Flavobacteriaceae bacterium]|nr:ribonuclease P protein component [Flavobacteriaceae bacterium]
MKPLKKNNKRVFILKKNTSFKKIFSLGLSFSSGDIVLMALFRARELGLVNIGFAVARHPSFNSVKKNRIKRLLKEAVLKNIGFVNENFSSGDYIVLYNGSYVPSSSKVSTGVLCAFKKLAPNKLNT